MNKSIFGITLVVILSYGQMSWAGDPAACISGLKTDESNNQIAIFFPRHVTASKTSVSVNDADITGLCEFMTDDGTDEIRCKLHFSQHPIAHIAGSPNSFFDVFVGLDPESDTSILTAGCTHGDVPSRTIDYLSARDADGHGSHTASSVSCTHSGIDTIVTCPPPPITPGIDPELATPHEVVRVKFSVPFGGTQM